MRPVPARRSSQAPSLYLLLACALLSGSAGAQQAPKQELRRFTSRTAPARHAGTYHLATGQWTRGAAQSLAGGAGSEIVYNNTVPSSYWVPTLSSETWTAPGRVPSTSSPNVVWNPAAVPAGSAPGSASGCSNSYSIDGFQIAYCSESVSGSTSMAIAFHQTWSTLCSGPVAGPPQGGPFLLTGLPGAATPGIEGCWTLNVDLAGSSASFTMLADGDGSYSANTDDAFAWTFSFPSATSSTSEAGPLLAGCPADGAGPAHSGIGWRQGLPATMQEAAGYDGTRFDGPAGALAPTYPANGAVGLPNPGGEAGSDAIGDDAFRIDGVPAYAGCHFFGGPIGSGGVTDGPYSNFHLELFANVSCVPTLNFFEYCAGDGLDPSVFTPCPCSNFGAPGNGCASSFNAAGAHLTMSGSALLGTARLDGSGMNATGNCIFLKGDVNLVGATVFGDGLRCAGGALIRLRTVALAAGAAVFPDSTSTVSLSVRGGTPVGSGLTAYYAVYYRNAAASFCPPATFNASNGTLFTW